MKKRGLKYLLTVVVCMSLLVSCGKNGGGEEPTPPTPPSDGYEAPDPPTQVNAYNMFTIDFWSRLDDGPLLKEGSSYADITTHVKSETTTQVFMLDRLDMTLGKPSPLVDIAVKTRYVPFFAPTGVTKYRSEGTGIIVQKPIYIFPGKIFADGLIISGCNVTLPLYRSREISVVTCKITAATEFEAVAKGAIDNINSPRVVVGTITTELEDDFREFLKYNTTDFRISVTEADTGAKAYKLFVLTPVYVVVRDVRQTSTGEIPLYRLKLEYLD
jgi:hypothetical protein